MEAWSKGSFVWDAVVDEDAVLEKLLSSYSTLVLMKSESGVVDFDDGVQLMNRCKNPG